MSIHQQRPFNVQHVVPDRANSGEGKPIERTAVANYLYVNRLDGIDRFGAMTRWSARTDLIAAGRVAPQRAEHPLLAGVGLWQAIDDVGQRIRPGESIMAHAVGSLPVNEDPEYWRQLVVGFAEDHFASQGMVLDFAIHYAAACADRPEILPHVHLLVTTRVFDPTSDRFGKRQQTWLRTPDACKAMADRWFAATGIYPPTGATPFGRQLTRLAELGRQNETGSAAIMHRVASLRAI
ncbi:MobA/MobL family protein [Sphingomonas oligophenolica]|uniref:MobA/MobL protein domain-containing protein n=1 Tax=Sphingomonas oligophenolica TaxID=301154 RepID=A0A502CB52_9SPHN|nr:MobA/MobL family protein [Sphingomonas oligophenolica]TPG10835.1 hypothetical protein EAH84_12200 [Sphingomonas oligophenolica]